MQDTSLYEYNDLVDPERLLMLGLTYWQAIGLDHILRLELPKYLLYRAQCRCGRCHIQLSDPLPRVFYQLNRLVMFHDWHDNGMGCWPTIPPKRHGVPMCGTCMQGAQLKFLKELVLEAKNPDSRACSCRNWRSHFIITRSFLVGGGRDIEKDPRVYQLGRHYSDYSTVLDPCFAYTTEKRRSRDGAEGYTLRVIDKRKLSNRSNNLTVWFPDGYLKNRFS